MCTAISFTAGDHYFGRNLDLEVSFGQEVVITPRNFPLKFRQLPDLDKHYAITGMALVQDHYPLYFDGANEKGLGMAGLNFDGPAHFFPVDATKDNIAPFEFIPYVLGQCATVVDVKQLLTNAQLAAINFSKKMPASPLHWMLADKSGAAIVIESTQTGLHIYDDPVGVLTNNPPFPEQMTNLANYQSVAPAQPTNTLVPGVNLNSYSRGLGTHFLPGGIDSASRFVKVAFTRAHAPKSDDRLTNVSSYFHLLESVAQPKGLDEVAPNTYEYTIYSDGVDLTDGTFYYTTYDNHQINAVKLTDKDGQALQTFPLASQQAINHVN